MASRSASISLTLRWSNYFLDSGFEGSLVGLMTKLMPSFSAIWRSSPVMILLSLGRTLGAYSFLTKEATVWVGQ
jgi:hypothetical protein